MFKDQIGKTMEVYVDGILVKSQVGTDHVHHLEEAFIILRKYQMKLNLSKCTFGVTSGKFLSYLIISVKHCMFIKGVKMLFSTYIIFYIYIYVIYCEMLIMFLNVWSSAF